MDETNIRQIIFSSKLFSGYRVFVDIAEHTTLKDIENFCVASLFGSLTNLNFIDQISELNNMSFHIHDLTFDKIRALSFNDDIYICDCSHM